MAFASCTNPQSYDPHRSSHRACVRTPLKCKATPSALTNVLGVGEYFCLTALQLFEAVPHEQGLHTSFDPSVVGSSLYSRDSELLSQRLKDRSASPSVRILEDS